MVKQMIKTTCEKKEVSMLLLPITNTYGGMRLNSYEQHVSVCKLVYTNKFIMLTFPEKLSIDVPSVWPRNILCQSTID